MADPSFKPGASAVPATKVEISVSCRNLKDRDTFSKSDPMCVLFTKSIGRDNLFEVGRTEMIKDSLNPDFIQKFVMDYFFEESQKLKFEVYDVDSPSSKLNAHDFLGRLECTLGEIVGAPGNKLDRKLAGIAKNTGVITVRAEEMANCKELVTMQLSGTKLDKKDFLGKSDPYLVISRANADGSFTVVHKTEVIKNSLNPTWRHISQKVRVLCHGDHDKPIKFDCYDWDSDGGHDFIGAFTSTLTELNKGGGSFELINPKKKAKKGKGYKNSGTINVLSCRIEKDHTFLDFVQGGMEINFTVAIDFTASNGDPRTPQSLHYINSYQPNQYANALGSVGEIIQDYDSDKMFPALGFGAKWPTGQVLHEFYLNANPSNPYCHGIQGVLEAYQNTLRTVQLWGPTNFSPCINHVAKFAAAYMDGSHYFVLLILTDGVITDMPQTKEAIVKASTLPMSIIIVGVGEADFDAMEELDADNHRLSAYGKYAERDIVQFVPFREFVGGRYGNNVEMSKAYLAKEVLAEVPEQVTGFMKKRGIKPKPPQAKATPGPAAAAGIGSQASGVPPAVNTPQQAGAPPPGSAPSQGYGQGGPPPGSAPPQGYGQGAPPPGSTPSQGYGQGGPPQGSAPSQGYSQGAPPPGSAPSQGYGQGAPPPGSAQPQGYGQGSQGYGAPQGSFHGQSHPGGYGAPQGQPQAQWGPPQAGQPTQQAGQQWGSTPPQGSFHGSTHQGSFHGAGGAAPPPPTRTVPPRGPPQTGQTQYPSQYGAPSGYPAAGQPSANVPSGAPYPGGQSPYPNTQSGGSFHGAPGTAPYPQTGSHHGNQGQPPSAPPPSYGSM